MHAFEIRQPGVQATEQDAAQDVDGDEAEGESHCIAEGQGQWEGQQEACLSEVDLHPGQGKRNRPECPGRIGGHVEEMASPGVVGGPVQCLVAGAVAHPVGVHALRLAEADFLFEGLDVTQVPLNGQG